jgi:hypothetical protein
MQQLCLSRALSAALFLLLQCSMPPAQPMPAAESCTDGVAVQRELDAALRSGAPRYTLPAGAVCFNATLLRLSRAAGFTLSGAPSHGSYSHSDAARPLSIFHQ